MLWLSLQYHHVWWGVANTLLLPIFLYKHKNCFVCFYWCIVNQISILIFQAGDGNFNEKNIVFWKKRHIFLLHQYLARCKIYLHIFQMNFIEIWRIIEGLHQKTLFCIFFLSLELFHWNIRENRNSNVNIL